MSFEANNAIGQKKILFIINPNSGIGRYKKVEKLTEIYLDKNKFHADFVYTEFSGHAKVICAKQSINYDILVAVGGDGSVNEVSQAVINSNAVLSVIPSGSGNGFARHLKIPLNLRRAIDIINDCHVKTIDTVIINDTHYVNLAGIGFDAEIAHKFAKTKKRGFFPYAKLILDDILLYNPQQYTIEIDEKTIVREVFFSVFANSSQWGYGAEIVPGAKIDDGLLNVCVFRKFPILEAPLLTSRLFDKSISKSKYSENYSAKKVKITSNKPQIFTHIDGEPVIFGNEINIAIDPLSLKVIIPAEHKQNLFQFSLEDIKKRRLNRISLHKKK